MKIDANTIVREALRLLAEEGQAGVTFRKLSARLGVQAPAIYWRFADKRELLDAMAESILLSEFPALGPYQGNDPRSWFVDLLGRLRRAMLSYPDGARIVAGARPSGAPTLARIPEYALAALETGGLDLAEAATIVFTAIHFTFGRAIEEQDSPGAANPGPEFARTYPTIARLLSTGPHDPELGYRAGLDLIIGA